MKTRYSADDMPSIAQRLKEIEAEKAARINGISLEDPQPTEAPADIDWTGMYGYPAGYAAPLVGAWTHRYVGGKIVTVKWDGKSWNEYDPFAA
jgi:hypothetical protein